MSYLIAFFLIMFFVFYYYSHAIHRRELINKIKEGRSGIATRYMGPEWAESTVAELGELIYGDEKYFDNVYEIGFARDEAALVTEISVFKNLERLDLEDIKNINSSAYLSINELKSLKILNLIDSSISDRELLSLTDLSDLEQLWLNETNVTDKGLSVCKNYPKLEILALCSLKITDEGLKHLSYNRQLKSLLISGSEITDIGLEIIVNDHPNLTYLNIMQTKISSEGIITLLRLDKLNVLKLDISMSLKGKDSIKQQLSEKFPNIKIWWGRPFQE